MARRQKLKVFRTPTGFHDAYVAAPSRKAALKAWGSDADLFARGIAEVVTDESLSREPLEHPGKVIKRSRGTVEEQLAALPPDAPRSRGQATEAKDDGEQPNIGRKRASPRAGRRVRAEAADRAGPEPPPKSQHRTEPKPKARPKSRPPRVKLDQAERGLRAVVERQEREEEELRDRARALEKERRAMEIAHERERRTAEKVLEREKEEHAERLDRWIKERG